MPGGFLAYALAGAATGAGQGLVNEARAKREMVMEELREQRLMAREDRQFGRQMQLAEQKNQWQTERDERQWSRQQEAATAAQERDQQFLSSVMPSSRGDVQREAPVGAPEPAMPGREGGEASAPRDTRQAQAGASREALLQRRRELSEAKFNAPSDDASRRIDALINQIDKELSSEQRDTAFDQRIQTLIETGLPREVAQGIVAGRFKADRDPVSGALQIVDMGTGQLVYPAPGGQAEQDGEQMGEGGGRTGRESTLPDDTDFLTATGVGGFTANLANTVADVFGGDLPNEEAERANQALNNLRVRTQIALASEVTGRPSNYLLQQFDQLAVRPAEISMGPARARERFQQTQSMLANEIQLTREIVNNPRNYQPSKVSNARIRLNELETLFNDYSRVIDSFDRRGGQARSRGRDDSLPQISSDDQYDALPSGARFVDPDGNVRQKP